MDYNIINVRIFNPGNYQIVKGTKATFFEDIQYRTREVEFDKDFLDKKKRRILNQFYNITLNLENPYFELEVKIINEFPLNNGKVAYIINYDYRVIGNRELSKFLELLKKGIYLNHKFIKNNYDINLLLSILWNIGYLKINGKENNYKDIKAVENIYKSTNLTYISLTKRCNLNCKYCVANANQNIYIKNEMKIDEVKFILDKINEYIIRNQKDMEYIIGITGGEPFLKKKLIFEILEYSQNKNYTINITTNGLLLTQGDIELLKKYDNLSINFSVDGHNQLEHEKYRGKGTFKKIISTLKKIIGGKPKIFINSFLCEDNMYTIEDRLDFFYELGVDGVNFINSFKRGMDKNSEYIHVDEGELFTYIFDILKKNKKYISLLRNESMFFGVLTRFLIGANIEHTGVGINEPLFINYDGGIYISPSLFENPIGKICNIKDINKFNELYDYDIVKTFKKYKIDNIPECNKCTFKYYCSGENFGETISVYNKLKKHFFCESRFNSLLASFEILAEDPSILYDRVNEALSNIYHT